MHCKMIPIKGKFFRGKPVYSCSSCGLTLGLEDPNTKVLCKVEAAKSDVTELLTKRMYHSPDRIAAENLLGEEPIEFHKGMTMRDKVATMARKRLHDSAKQDGRIAPNKDNTAAYEILNQQAADYAEKYMEEKAKPVVSEEDKKKMMCTQEEINQRLSICETCEYYENNTCLQCGCAISRASIHSNKLAFRNKSCPVNKWGPIQIPVKGDESTSDGSGSG
jgi:hypothetical protein